MEKQVITLISDWGWDDVSLGLLKWELFKRFPEACVVDIMHEVELLDFGQTAFVMSRLYDRFPEGSVHLLLTGVSRWTREMPVIAQVDGHFFIGIDNGVLPAIFPDGRLQTRCYRGDEGECVEQMVQLAVACIEGSYEEVSEDAQLETSMYLLRYSCSEDGMRISGNVMYIDRHHNIVTNIPSEVFKGLLGEGRFELVVSGTKITRFHEGYAKDVEPYLLPDSLGVLEIISYGAKLRIMPRWEQKQEIVIHFFN